MLLNREKPKRSVIDGLYHFICEECAKDFTANDPRAKTCCQRCRNAKNKRKRKTIEKTEDEFTKKYKHNSRVLRRLFRERLLPVEEQTLQLTHFNNDIQVLTLVKGNLQYQVFGDFAITRINKTQYNIIPKHEL